ncbi:MAG: hypothetical protein IJD85_03165 [Oscillospiraceae bacterium]|nr:hypothetical protein [Oscillospiraceae bacterium]
MKNIMKAQLIQLRKDKICRFIFIGVLAVTLIIVLMMADMASGDIRFTGGEQAIMLLTMTQLLAQLLMYLFTAQACGADFMDKTCNYEIMSGHTRRDVFFGRVIPTLIIGTLGTLFLIAAPVVAEVIILGGWGDKVSLTDMLLRFLLMAFPVARVICEFIFLTFIIKNPYIVMGISYMLCIILGMNIPVTRDHCFVLGMSNMNAITVIDRWNSFGLGGDLYYVYETGLSADFVLPTVIVSVVIGAAALLLGYTFFKNDDMH